jgi:hypothetical protein
MRLLKVICSHRESHKSLLPLADDQALEIPLISLEPGMAAGTVAAHITYQHSTPHWHPASSEQPSKAQLDRHPADIRVWMSRWLSAFSSGQWSAVVPSLRGLDMPRQTSGEWVSIRALSRLDKVDSYIIARTAPKETFMCLGEIFLSHSYFSRPFVQP